MIFHDLGRIGPAQDERHRQEKDANKTAELGRKRRRQALVLMICASASWGLVALLYYGVALTETYWSWSG